MDLILLYGEINGLCAAIFAILLFKIATGADQSTSQRLFCSVLAACILLFCFDMANYIIPHLGNPSLRLWSIFTNTCYFITIGAIGYLWYLYTEISIDPELRQPAIVRVLEFLPLAVLVVASLATPNTGWLFTIDTSCVYHRGPLHILQLIICFGYLMVASIYAIHHGLRTRDYDLRHRMFSLASFSWPVIIAGALQIVLPNIPIVCAGATLSLLYVYNEMRERLISIDPLTQVNGRNQLFRYLSDKMEDAEYDGSQLALLMIDADNFKQINDKFGHVEGDAALRRIGTALKNACSGRPAGIYRYGGDEFMVGMEISDSADIGTMMQHIHQALEEENARADADYALSVSIGYAEYDPSVKTPSEFIKLADAALYREKQKRKEAERRQTQEG